MHEATASRELHDSKSGGTRDRWTILALSCAAIWSQCYCYDIPAAVHDHLSTYSGVHASDFPWFFNALYSAYSLPNFVLPLAFGWFVDKSTGSMVLTLLATLACSGQLLLVVGVLSSNPWTSITGRVLFGIGCESMGVGQTAILTHVFSGHEIAFALALNISCARLATMTNDLLSPLVSSTLGTPAAFILGFAFTLTGVLCTLWLTRILAHEPAIVSHERSTGSLWSSTKELGSRFWMVALMCVCGYACILPFTSVFVAMKPAGLTQVTASHTVSVVFLVSAILTPAFGRLIDRIGRAAWISTMATLLLCLTHAMYTTYEHAVVMIILGVAYAAFVAAIWPMIPLTVESTHVGLAYGIVTSIQNLGLTIVPVLIATLRTTTGSYASVRWLFLGLSMATLVLSIWLTKAMGICRDTDSEIRRVEDRLRERGLDSQYGTTEPILYTN